MSDMPERIVCNPERRSWRNAKGSGQGKKVETPRTEYIRADIADQLATALLRLHNDFIYFSHDKSPDTATHHTALIEARQVIEAYRKAKGE